MTLESMLAGMQQVMNALGLNNLVYIGIIFLGVFAVVGFLIDKIAGPR